MVNFIDLTNAFVDVLRRISQLVEDLTNGAPESVVGYIDENPKKNSVSAAIYGQKPGTVLVVWQETTLTEGEMSGWVHRVEIYVKAKVGGSAYTLLDDIINGVPDPGDGQRWRYCPVMSGVYNTTVTAIARLINSEGIDYYVIQTETPETGDA